VPDAADAQLIVLEPGEERAGLDFSIRDRPLATIAGSIRAPGDIGSLSFGVHLVSRTTGPGFQDPWSVRVNREARTFTVNGVPAGEYLLVGYVTIPTRADATGDEVGTLWTDTITIVMSGEHVTGVALSPRPGVDVSGRLRMDSTSTIDRSRLALRLIPGHSDGVRLEVPWATAGADGRFRWRGVTPGRYRVDVVSMTAQPLLVERVAINSGDATLALIDVGSSDISELDVTVTERVASLSGRLRTPSGEPRTPGRASIGFPASCLASTS
jgi:hypothetical protein